MNVVGTIVRLIFLKGIYEEAEEATEELHEAISSLNCHKNGNGFVKEVEVLTETLEKSKKHD